MKLVYGEKPLHSYDFHVHTHHSIDSAINPYRITNLAKRSGLKGLAITDHDTIKGGLDVLQHAGSDLHVIVGSEIRTDMGEMIGLFLNEEVKSTDPLEVIDIVKSQDGLTILPHPFRTNIFRRSNTTIATEIAEKVDAIEVINARTSISSNEKAFLLAKKLNKPMIAGSDAHFHSEMGHARTLLPLCNNDEELKRAILEGRTIVEGKPYNFIRALPFYLLGFVYSRTRKISQQIHLA